MKIRNAYETLNDAQKRHVYDKFGSFECQNCKTRKEYFYTGLSRQAGMNHITSDRKFLPYTRLLHWYWDRFHDSRACRDGIGIWIYVE
jgi:hypothetical protein